MTPQSTHRDDGGAGGGERGRWLAMINTRTRACTSPPPGTWFPEQGLFRSCCCISCLLTVQSASGTHNVSPPVFLSDSISPPAAGLLSIYQPLCQSVTPSCPEFKQPHSSFIHFIFFPPSSDCDAVRVSPPVSGGRPVLRSNTGPGPGPGPGRPASPSQNELFCINKENPKPACTHPPGPVQD